nr:hypothetical protein GCM10020093_045340 [Planobispora longispora]
MTVYAVAQISIHDRQRYDKYVAGFMDVLVKYGGRLLAAQENPEVVEGEWPHEKIILLSFEDRRAFEVWAGSPSIRRSPRTAWPPRTASSSRWTASPEPRAPPGSPAAGGRTEDPGIALEPVVVVAEVELRQFLLAGPAGHRELGEPLEVALPGRPGEKCRSMEAGSPDSLRKAWIPPSGTWMKSPGVASIQRSPVKIRTVPVRMKNDSEIDRWKWGPGPEGSGPMFHR